MKSIILFFILLAASAYAAVLCQYGVQDTLMTAGNTKTVTFTTMYTAGSCECSFLPHPSTNITCCTNENWTPVATEMVGACRCVYTAHQTIPANTFDFYACANTM